jgi:uncharacterized membrane protein
MDRELIVTILIAALVIVVVLALLLLGVTIGAVMFLRRTVQRARADASWAEKAAAEQTSLLREIRDRLPPKV